MAGGVYGAFEFAPKPFTRGSDIGKGQVGIQLLDPPLFLQQQLIGSHGHTGIDSVQLSSGATPEAIRGFAPRQREEHGTAPWAGGAAASGSVAVTFATPFLSAPMVLATPADGSANFSAAVGSVTTTGFTLYWKDNTAGTHAAVNINWLALG